MGDVIYGIVAIIIGVAASLGLYWLLDFAVRQLPDRIQTKIRFLAFLLPAAVLVILVLLVPLVQTVVFSFMNDSSKKWVGLENYTELFGSSEFLSLLLNNFLWVAFVPAVTVGVGLLFATLTNQVGPSREKIFKSLIFLPMSISFVSAATIWAFIYVFVPPGRPEIGLLNTIVIALGGHAQPWMTIDTGRLNSFLLMIIVVWLQAGFSMVLLSAAIKAVPEETIEAARIDGASVTQVFWKVVVPQIRGTIMSVFITTLILVMKIFDIVLAMTGGNFNTSVLGMEFYKQFFLNANSGAASAVVTILVILIIPLMWLQIRTVKHQETLR
jgi:alpha-glucoside transport system permease protein